MNERWLRFFSTAGLLILFALCFYIKAIVWLVFIFALIQVIRESIQVCNIGSKNLFCFGLIGLIVLLTMVAIYSPGIWIVSVMLQNIFILAYLYRWPSIGFMYPMLWVWSWVFSSVLWVLLTQEQWGLLFQCVMAIAVVDVSAYVVGKTLARHYIFPVLSPKKSLEGWMGSFVALSMFLNFIFSQHGVFIMVMMSLVMSTMVMIGDVFISSFKRTFSTKDTGALIPGHGGVMDRMDGYLMVIPWVPVFQHLL